jgi:hypothetical protein
LKYGYEVTIIADAAGGLTKESHKKETAILQDTYPPENVRASDAQKSQKPPVGGQR